MRAKLMVVLAVCVAAGVVAWLYLAKRPHGSRAPAVGSASLTASSGTRASGTTEAHVRRLAPDDRRRLGEQIAAAIHRARPPVPTGAPSHGSAGVDEAQDPVIPLEEASKPLQKALAEATTLLADCYTQHGKSGSAAATAIALMTMASDPELGTVIDTSTITSADGNPLDREVDECMRDTIDRLALPPLGKPGRLQLQYSFRFDGP